uniref:Uncharacterized protein n=1 Tax=Siphoviridae sp. ctLdn10 TaxID=2827847 RepID=A0A8S5SQN7_9CAUD|nr:MAG TPA: hypothetical protein [Siphoviridae sp. ctLdn10]DAN27184.1 MAG TPA: hypothetical protein [Caudoviricetes sp.]
MFKSDWRYFLTGWGLFIFHRQPANRLQRY